MQYQLEKKITKKIKDVSHTLGVNEAQVVNRALRYYFASIKSAIDLKQECDAWDMLSDEALTKMKV